MADHSHSHAGLDVRCERTSEGTAKVSFTVTAEEFEKTVRLGLRNVASRARLKGFRPGKVPPALIEKEFGSRVRRDAAQHFVEDAYRKAIDEDELRPAAHPRIDLTNLAPEPGQPMQGEFEVYLRPAFELQEYRGLVVETRPVAVSDEEVAAALEDLKRQQSRPEPAGPEGLAADGMALCKFEFFQEGSDTSLLTRDGIRASPRTPPPGVDPALFEERMTGAVDGATVDIPLTFPNEFPTEAARGRNGICRVTVNQAFRIVPPTDEQILALVGVEDEAALQAKAKERLLEAKREEERVRIESELLDQVIELHPMTIPPGYLEEQVRAKAEETRRNLVAQGMPEEAAQAQVDEQLDALRDSAEKALRAIYLIEDIAKKENLLVTKEELAAELASIAEYNGVSVDEVRKYYRENNLVPQLALELLERKIRSFLRESADIREAAAEPGG